MTVRSILLATTVLLLAAPAAVSAQSAAARAEATLAPAATATRNGEQVRLEWVGLSGPVEIIRLDRPDATAGTRLAHSAGGLSATVATPAWPRPYYLLRDAEGHSVRLAERVLPLEGGNNFRDLGGYAGDDGRPVVWGQLFRSGVMAGLTPDDFRHLGELGIATVCDFRSADERGKAPVKWPEGVHPNVLATDYALEMGALSALFRGGPVTWESVATAMEGFYRDLPFTFAPQYQRMLRAMVDGKVPLAFNCSAGKDRTGVAAALILTLLGADRETVMADYLLSNQYYRPAAVRPDDPAAAMFAKLPPDAVKALMGVDRRYLEASFAAIDARGGMELYARDHLGLTPADVLALRQRYLTPRG